MRALPDWLRRLRVRHVSVATAPADVLLQTVAVLRHFGVRVLRCDVADVTLEARWRILGGDGKELALRRSTVTEVVGAPGYGAMVAAMSRALGALSRDIATAIRDLPQ